MSQQLFSGMIAHAERDGVTFATSNRSRWLTRLSEADAELMAKGESEDVILSRQMRASFVSHESTRFLVTTGFPECEDLPPGVESAPLTPGLFAVSVLGLDIAPIGTGYAIRDALEDLHEGVAGYEGHSLDVVIPLFPRLSCFQLDPAFAVTKSPSRVIGSYLSRSYVDGPLPLSDDLRSTMSDFFETGSRHIPFGIALQGLLSFTWSSFFIELYRCVEQLYAVPRLVELTAEWQADRSLHDVAELIERTLSWRPKEDESLTRLLQGGCTMATLNAASQALKAEVAGDQSRVAEIAARAIYKSRNSFVHFRPSKSSSPMGDREWDAFLQAMAAIIVELYGKFGRTFHSGAKA